MDKLIEDIINNITLKYKFMGFTNEQITKMVDLLLKQKKYNDYELLKNDLINEIHMIIKNTLAKDELVYPLINNYINDCFSKTTNYQEIINSFSDFSAFLEDLNYFPDPYIINDLINNNSMFNSKLELIVNHDKKPISLYPLDDLYKNNVLYMSVDTYCTINSIKIYDEDNNNNNIMVGVEDSIKLYLKEISSYPLLSYEQTQELFKNLNTNPENRKILIEHNLRLSVKMAKRYSKSSSEFLDLIQDGNIGLMNAIDRFDVSRGTKFSTYAMYWIRQSIVRSLADKSRIIRIPVYLNDKSRKVSETEYILSSKLGRKPTIDEIANELGCKSSEVNKLYYYSQDMVSLNSPVGEDNDVELSELIPSNDLTPEEEYMKKDLSDSVHKLLGDSNLTSREIEIILYRFGFYNNNPLTLAQVGQKFNITRERVRQIEDKALRKLKTSSEAKQLYKTFYNKSVPSKTKDINNVYRNNFRYDYTFDYKKEVMQMYYTGKEYYNIFNSINNKKVLENAIINMDYREQKIVLLFFDNKEGEEKTISDLANLFNISSDAVRKILSKSICLYCNYANYINQNFVKMLKKDYN